MTTGASITSDGRAGPWPMPTLDIATHFAVICSDNGYLVITKG